MTDNIKFQVMEEEDIYSTTTVPIQNKGGGITNTVLENQPTFEQVIQQFLQRNKIKLYILTPCFASLCYVNYVHCLMGTVELFRKLNIPLKIEFCRNDSLVSRARNNLIARAMTDPDATHFLFIDNDISWDPVDILKLLIAEKDLVGGIYPLKNYSYFTLFLPFSIFLFFF